MRAIVPNIKTVDIPAPTAASVKATSTASKVTNNNADSKLNTLESITTAKRRSILTIARAVSTNIENKTVLVKVSIIS